MWIQDPMGIEYMNKCIAFIVICCRSTSPPGGNQVDGLPSVFIVFYCFSEHEINQRNCKTTCFCKAAYPWHGTRMTWHDTCIAPHVTHLHPRFLHTCSWRLRYCNSSCLSSDGQSASILQRLSICCCSWIDCCRMSAFLCVCQLSYVFCRWHVDVRSFSNSWRHCWTLLKRRHPGLWMTGQLALLRLTLWSRSQRCLKNCW